MLPIFVTFVIFFLDYIIMFLLQRVGAPCPHNFSKCFQFHVLVLDPCNVFFAFFASNNCL
jgi:hypothetical protein